METHEMDKSHNTKRYTISSIETLHRFFCVVEAGFHTGEGNR
jgi:hypothetical protein